MQTIDLKATSSESVRRKIAHLCGGTVSGGLFSKWVGKGVGGMSFTDPADEECQYPYKVNLAFYPQGLGVYFRNKFANRLVLLPQDEIRHVEIHQPAETIKPFSYSPYSILRKGGFTHAQAASFLMPAEITEQGTPSCKITTFEQYIDLQLSELKVEKLMQILGQSASWITIQAALNPPLILPRRP